MNKFLLRTFSFILPIIVFMFLADFIVSKSLLGSKYYSEGELNVWNDIFTENINSDLVIYGSSRAWVHFNPKIIENSLQITSYNLGIDGHNFWLQYLRHKELLKFNKKPKQILLSLDMFTLEKNKDFYNYQQFLPYLLWNNDLYEFTSSYNGFSTYDYFVPLIRFKNDLPEILTEFNSDNYCKSPARTKGYLGIDKSWNSDLEKAKFKINYYNLKINTLTLALFEQFINECNKSGLNLILVYSPEYIEGRLFVKNRENIIHLYKYFAKKYNLQFLDYSDHSICQQKHFFYNSTHLNKKEA